MKMKVRSAHMASRAARKTLECSHFRGRSLCEEFGSFEAGLGGERRRTMPIWPARTSAAHVGIYESGRWKDMLRHATDYVCEILMVHFHSDRDLFSRRAVCSARWVTTCSGDYSLDPCKRALSFP